MDNWDEKPQEFETVSNVGESVRSDGEIQLQCRMYRKELPDLDDLVMVKVLRMDQIQGFLSLLEYDNGEGKEASIQFAELSRSRMRSVHKHLRIGKEEVMQVYKVDKEKGYVDLSKKNLKPADIEEHMEFYAKSKAVHSIMKHTAEKTRNSTIVLYENFGWDLYDNYDHAYDAFQEALTDPSVFDEYDIDDNVKTELLKQIEHRFAVQPVKLQADVEVTCFSRVGINGVIDALNAGLELAKDDEDELKIQLVSTPVYAIHTVSANKEVALERLSEVIQRISEVIKEKGGNCIIKEEPRVID